MPGWCGVGVLSWSRTTGLGLELETFFALLLLILDWNAQLQASSNPNPTLHPSPTALGDTDAVTKSSFHFQCGVES